MATENDSYCDEAQVISYAQYLYNFSGSTVPTQAQVLDFMAFRAGELYSILVDVMGDNAQGPASYSNTVDTSTDPGKALNFTLIMFNAIGAAMDALAAAGMDQSPEASKRVEELAAMYTNAREALTPLAKVVVATTATTRASNHISKGLVTQLSPVVVDEQGVKIDSNTEF